MDGVLVDFGWAIQDWFDKHPHLVERYKEFPDHIQGLFRNPPPIEGAIEAVKKLHDSGKYELFIATQLLGVMPVQLLIKDYGLRTTLVICSTKRCL